MATVAAEIKDYDTEYEAFSQKLALNKKSFQKIMSSSTCEISTICQNEYDLLLKTKGEIQELQEKINGIQLEIKAVYGDKDRAGREFQHLRQELEQINMDIDEKIHEKETVDKKLAEAKCRLKEKELQVEDTERKNQEQTSNVEKGAQLFRKHLGLDIQRTNHSTLVFTFTKISRSEPEKEYFLELTLDGDNYRLISSVPPLHNLKQLEDKLNATNDFSGCIAYIRKLFQKFEA
ncbi:kinetochore protein Spc25 [Penaeus vannamei]|uniref:Kinetochore protein SPC25 n=1 Tax=Penaeus vannamei TaxID=6689 RepID=A0A3R7P859_PENVA|nr:uncharacterized protein LOC113803404 [Penaeus vannamei]ROT78194.1 hypothetical protein C7M84_003087 [Penaeus vannamei]